MLTQINEVENITKICWAAMREKLSHGGMNLEPWNEAHEEHVSDMRDGVKWLLEHPLAGARNLADFHRSINGAVQPYEQMQPDTRKIYVMTIGIVRAHMGWPPDLPMNNA